LRRRGIRVNIPENEGGGRGQKGEDLIALTRLPIDVVTAV